VIWNDQKITKRVLPQNTIYIITAIYSTKKDARKKVIATDSLSTPIAASDKKQTMQNATNQKTT
jgi:hypothetical protein